LNKHSTKAEEKQGLAERQYIGGICPEAEAETGVFKLFYTIPHVKSYPGALGIGVYRLFFHGQKPALHRLGKMKMKKKGAAPNAT
jgi:hypothetical protein